RQHSRASRVMISLMDVDGAIRMDIVDDGVGMDDPENRRRNPESGFGLDFIGSRRSELGGELVIASTPGSGFAVSAALPGQSRLRTRGGGPGTTAQGTGAGTGGRLGEGGTGTVGGSAHSDSDPGESPWAFE